MPTDKSIFGLRFGSSAEISPSQEELDAFLRSPKKSGRKELHGHDTASYGELLRRIRAIEQRAGAKLDLREKMFYFVLSHSCFFSPALKSAVEHYKYYLHALATLDFKKPTAFIVAAEAEMNRLNPKKGEDRARLARLQFMADDRRKALKALEKRRDALTGELLNIAGYVRDNLAKIKKLCETSIVVLVNVGVGRSEEGRMIEAMREWFEENLMDYESDGMIPRRDPESVGSDVEQLSKEISRIFREDVYALATLYEAVHDHAHKTVLEIDAFQALTKNSRNKGGGDDTKNYVRLEGVLVSLVSDFRFALKSAGVPADSSHPELLRETRNEMVDRLFELLQQERRKRVDRRKMVDRRRYRDPYYRGPERRTGQERRSEKSRRKT